MRAFADVITRPVLCELNGEPIKPYAKLIGEPIRDG